jgi:hypothetical protein
LNSTWQLDTLPRHSTQFTVSSVDVEPRASTNVWLAGGEALQLQLIKSATDSHLVHSRYQGQGPQPMSPATEAQAGARGADPYWVASHSPDTNRATGTARFLISIQNADERRFSPRPAEAWVEVTPLLEGGAAAEPYRFCDMNFAPGMPVPVLSCLAQQFPLDDCRKVRVELFFKEQKTPPDIPPLPVDQLVRDREGVRLPLAATRLSAKTSVEPGGQLVVEVREVADGDSEAPQKGRVKIELNPPPVRIVHDYSAGSHQFFYPSGTNLAQCEVRLTSRASLEKGARRYTLAEQLMPRTLP